MKETNISPGMSDSPAAESDWVALLHDSARSGGQKSQAVPAAPVRARWQTRTGGPVRSSPILRDGILYVAAIPGIVHAFNVETGRAKWTFQAPGQIHSTPSL